MSLIPQPASLFPEPVKDDLLLKPQRDLREIIQRVDAASSRQGDEADAANDPAAENLNGLVGRIASASIEEIDRVILELQSLRDMLRSEGERVSREITGYASLNHASMAAMKIVGDNLKQWKGASVNHKQRYPA